jgi:Holliday junction resolvase
VTNYAKGTRYEKKSRAWLEERGYWVVEARGSHGAADLVAINHDGVLVIQCKSGRALGPKERGEVIAKLLAIPVPANGQRQLMTWTKYARTPTVEIV